ncbi:MAG: vWA domain-containing protein [Candidatus Asgardarchaeia archaeon]
MPYKENAKKIRASLPSEDIKGKTRVPIAKIKQHPKVKRTGYFSYSIQAIIRSVKNLTGKIGKLWSKEKTEHFLVTTYKDESKKIPMAKIVMERGDGNLIRKTGEKILDDFNSKLGQVDSRKFLFRWPYDKRRVKMATPGRRELFSKSKKGRARGYQVAENLESIAIVPTIKKIILSSGRINKQIIRREHLVMYKYWSKSSVALILILDTSTSMIPHIYTLKKAIIRLYREFRYYRDKLGIVVIQGDKAKILQNPTTNIMLIKKAIDQLTFGGKSPLADGLMKALFLIRHEKRRNPHIIFLPILISDGLANVPLSEQERYNVEGYEAQLDVLKLARIYRSEAIPIVVINPIETDEWISKGFLSPTLLLKKVAQITNGSYYGYKTGFFRTEFSTQEATNILIKELEKLRKVNVQK